VAPRESLGLQFRRTFLLALGTSLVLTLTVAGVGVLRVSASLDRARDGLRRLELLPRIAHNLGEMQLSEDRWLTSADLKDLERFHQQSDTARADIQALAGLVDDEETRRLAGRLAEVAARYRGHVDAQADVLSGRRVGDDPARLQELTRNKKASVAEMDALGGELLRSELERAAARLRASFSSLVWSIGGMVAITLLAILIAFRSGSTIVLRLTHLAAAVRGFAASESRLDRRIPVDGTDELGEVAAAFNALLAAQQETIAHTLEIAKELGHAAERIRDAAREVGDGARRQHAGVGDATQVVESVVDHLREIATAVSSTVADARTGAAAAQLIQTSSTNLAQQANQVSEAVAETGLATAHLTSAVEEVAARTEVLSSAAKTTADEMAAVNASIAEVRARAGDAARSVGEVVRAATAGAQAVREAIVGIDRIHEESDLVVRATGDLVRHVEHIGGVVEVIEEVADRTKLLALNAGILAAGAGEAGAGFAVVASEIKELAGRTRASTGEIAEAIGAVREAADRSLAASSRGAAAVDAGVQLGRTAEHALAEILEGIRTSSDVARLIAGATDRQASSTALLQEAMEGVASSVVVIAKATGQETEEVRQIHAGVERLRKLADQMTIQSGEAQAAARGVANSVGGATARMASVERAHTEQSQANNRLIALMREITTITRSYQDVAQSLERSAQSLSQSARSLTDPDRST
jgi:methyl-accepting chemotaxis protein